MRLGHNVKASPMSAMYSQLRYFNKQELSRVVFLGDLLLSDLSEQSAGLDQYGCLKSDTFILFILVTELRHFTVVKLTCFYVTSKHVLARLNYNVLFRFQYIFFFFILVGRSIAKPVFTAEMINLQLYIVLTPTELDGTHSTIFEF